MATNDDTKKDDKILALELALEEQRKDYDILHGLHEAVKIRVITFLAAALGLLAYLYTTDGKGTSLKDRLFVPDEPYGVIFYAFGLLLLLSSVATLMVALIKTREWHTAYDNSQEEGLLEDYEKYLQYMRNRYLKISRINGSGYEKRRYLLSISFLPLVIGATILLLLKTFGG